MLPKNMSLLNYHGKPVYVLPDVEKNQAYVSGQKQYEAYRDLRATEHLDSDNPGTPQMSALNFGGWDGANAMESMGTAGPGKH